jgi:malic enzyme
VSPEELRPGFVIPSVFDTTVGEAVATAVAEAAVVDGVCRPQR